MNYNKNVVEEALFQIRNLEETLQENAKGILQSTMSEEIKQLVKESLREQDEIEEPIDDEEMVALKPKRGRKAKAPADDGQEEEEEGEDSPPPPEAGPEVLTRRSTRQRTERRFEDEIMYDE